MNADRASDPRDVVRPLRHTRQYREFTDEPISDEDMDALTDVARWTGSSTNNQPWRFLVIRSPDAIRRIHDAGLPQTRPLRTATAAIAIILPADPDRAVIDAYDEGRAAERILIAASMLGLGGGIAFIQRHVRPVVSEVLGLPPDRLIRSLVALGHPTEAARQPKNPPGKGRLPRDETVFEERWPAE